MSKMRYGNIIIWGWTYSILQERRQLKTFYADFTVGILGFLWVSTALYSVRYVCICIWTGLRRLINYPSYNYNDLYYYLIYHLFENIPMGSNHIYSFRGVRVDMIMKWTKTSDVRVDMIISDDRSPLTALFILGKGNMSYIRNITISFQFMYIKYWVICI